MSKKDFELVARIINTMHFQGGNPNVSVGNQRRALALTFAQEFAAAYPNFNPEKFVDAAVHNI